VNGTRTYIYPTEAYMRRAMVTHMGSTPHENRTMIKPNGNGMEL
jgi:hypothetical protein